MAFDGRACLADDPIGTASVKERARADPAGDRTLIFAAGALVIIQLWFGMLPTSLWLDETGTWWIIRDGPSQAIHRALSWSGQSPLYYLIAWLSARLFGLNEIALRLPSVLAMAGAVAFLYWIAQRIFDRVAAAAVAYVFLCVASFYAADARPYALALLCLTGSFLALLRWLDTRRPIYAVLYVVASALVIYAHCVLSLPLAASAAYGAFMLRREPRGLLWLAAFQMAIVALSIPLLGELKKFYATRSAHTFAGLPTTGDLLAGFVPCSLAGVLILLVWLCLNLRGEAGITGRFASGTALLVGTWALFAPLVLFLLPAFSGLRLFVDRYYSSSLPGQALLIGGLLSSIDRGAVRKALIVLLAVASILAQGRLTTASHGDDDWRDALAFLNREAGSLPVLMVSPFVEGADFQSLEDPELRDILFAPQKYYGEPPNAIRLPHLFPDRELPALEARLAPLAHEPRFYFINDKPDRSYEIWLLGRYGARCKSEPVGQGFGLVRISRFTCAA